MSDLYGVNPAMTCPFGIMSHSSSAISSVRKEASQQKVTKAAVDFEATLLTTLFQKMEESISMDCNGDEGATEGNFRDFGAQQLASALAASGGFGIARIVIPHLTSSHP